MFGKRRGSLSPVLIAARRVELGLTLRPPRNPRELAHMDSLLVTDGPRALLDLQSQMGRLAWKNDQVLRTVVESIAIDVMDNFPRKQIATELPSSNNTMNTHLLSIDIHLPVVLGVSTPTYTPALHGAEHTAPLTDFCPTDVERLAALFAPAMLALLPRDGVARLRTPPLSWGARLPAYSA
jgi:hypothetical protein